MLNLSQIELAKKAGITERSIYNYEQAGAFPRPDIIKALASALGVSLAYLLDEEEQDPLASLDKDIFLANVRNEYGPKGAKEAKEVLSRASALFAGGELDEEAKDIFFQSLMEVYLESKNRARDKFTPQKRKSKKAEMK